MTITTDQLVTAYLSGFFPMADPDGEVRWFSPNARGIIDLATFAPGRTLRNLRRHHPFVVRVDTAFGAVMTGCGKRKEGTWLSDDLKQLYLTLHQARLAHSVECWLIDPAKLGIESHASSTTSALQSTARRRRRPGRRETATIEGAATLAHLTADQRAQLAGAALADPGAATVLVGGLYGVSLGGAFFGESMYHTVTGASNVAMMALVDRLRELGFKLLDTQWLTPHLARLGGSEIARSDYLTRLRQALLVSTTFATPPNAILELPRHTKPPAAAPSESLETPA